MSLRKLLIFHNGRTNPSQTGAALVEFVIGFPLIVLTIIFLVDTGLYLFQKSLLTEATAKITRQLSTDLGQRQADARKANPNLAGAEPSYSGAGREALLGVAKATFEKIRGDNPVLVKDMSFESKLSPSNPYYLLTTHGRYKFHCLTCIFFPRELYIFATSVLAIERPTSSSAQSYGEDENGNDDMECLSVEAGVPCN